MQPNRLAEGGRIDRERPLAFTFDGRAYQGFAGDTLASALLANDVLLVGRSFKYHRPRGIFSAGAEEPNALVALEEGAHAQPNPRATQIELYEGLKASSVNRWPSLAFDLMRVNDRLARLLPAGFYYKTFMWPRGLWSAYEHLIRSAAGLGRAPSAPDPDRYERRHVHCDVLVVGGGPAGLAAALAAGRTGARVILADEQAEPGGALLGRVAELDGAPALEWVAKALAELGTMTEVTLLARTTAFGYYDHNLVALVERVTDHLGPGAAPSLPRQRLWRVRARRVVLATGAIERPLVFADNDKPGVMLAGAARAYLNRYGVRPGRRAVVFTNNDDAYHAARELQAGGVAIAAIVDPRPEPPIAEEPRAQGVEVLSGSVVTAVAGGRRVRGVEVTALDGTGAGLRGQPRAISCDLACVSGGWNPAVHLFSQSGGRLEYVPGPGHFAPGTSKQACHCAGAVTGAFGLGECLDQGFAAGAGAAAEAGVRRKGRARKAPFAPPFAETPAMPLWFVPASGAAARGARHFVDPQTDVTVADIRLAAREGYRSVEHVKRYTTLGMGTDQGKTGNIAGLAILSAALDSDIAGTGTTTFRPPYTPVTFGALAGRDVGALADPVRRTPIHHWHESIGAVFEDVGQWRRPYCYPRAGETKALAVERECLAARNAVGIMDASTLGKIELKGADVVTLLNRLYTNAWDKLAVGRCRYGMMCGEDGMVMDDGVTSRLGERRFLMTTTTGNAARVMAWIEEWLQTEWPELEVFANSVTEQWANVTIAGPRARELLAEVTDDIDLASAAFPFMSWRAGRVAGLPARVFRVSFTGEVSFEINVPSSHGLALWTALMTTGEKYGITPFGTEAMHVLRAEKGYIIVGQETDGTVTPYDLGMEWVLSGKKDFLGRRSLAREESRRADRKQLVGLRAEDPREVLPEGAHLAAAPDLGPPVAMIGHVTSSYFSVNLGHAIALALVKGGRARMGETLYAPLPLAGRVVRATLCEPVFLDPEGKRLHG